MSSMSNNDDLKKLKDSLKKKEEELEEKLSKASKLSVEDAKRLLLNEVQKDLTEEIAKKIRASEERIKIEANEKAREILADAMKHGATSYVAEYSVSSVAVPNEDVKGGIMGE